MPWHSYSNRDAIQCSALRRFRESSGVSPRGYGFSIPARLCDYYGLCWLLGT